MSACFRTWCGVEFVAYAGELVGMSAKDALQRAHEVLDYVGLGEARYRKVESYSTGMKQRLKLASAIVHDPKLLILDEPTNGMDPAGRQDILELARDLAHNKGMSLLFSSHLLPDVETVCDYVIVLGNGKLLAAGKIQRTQAGSRPVFRGAAQGRRRAVCEAANHVRLVHGTTRRCAARADPRRAVAAGALASGGRRASADSPSASTAQHAGRGLLEGRGAIVMPIFDQGYQHWSGTLSGHAWRWLPITRHGVRESRQVGTRASHRAASCMAAGARAGVMLCLWGLFERGSDLVAFLKPDARIPWAGRSDSTRDSIASKSGRCAYSYFLAAELTFSMILVLLVGPNLISQDLRYNACRFTSRGRCGASTISSASWA